MTDVRLAGIQGEALGDGTPYTRLSGAYLETLAQYPPLEVWTANLYINVLTEAPSGSRQGWGLICS